MLILIRKWLRFKNWKSILVNNKDIQNNLFLIREYIYILIQNSWINFVAFSGSWVKIIYSCEFLFWNCEIESWCWFIKMGFQKNQHCCHEDLNPRGYRSNTLISNHYTMFPHVREWFTLIINILVSENRASKMNFFWCQGIFFHDFWFQKWALKWI